MGSRWRAGCWRQGRGRGGCEEQGEGWLLEARKGREGCEE